MYHKLVIISLQLSLLCIGQLTAQNVRVSNSDSVRNPKNPKIVGGSPGYVPYAVSIFHKQGFYICGGVIISKTVIATTSRCATLFQAKDLMVRSGSRFKDHGGSFTPVRWVARHEKFTDQSPDYDVGILLLDGEADEKSRAIKLAEEEVNDGEVLIVSAWGSTEENGPLSDMMNSVRVKKIGRDECQRFHGGEYEITPRMICGSSPDTALCNGDVGGPVVRKGQLVGIISFGLGCGKPGRPIIFTNVAAPEIRKFLEDRPGM